MVTWKDKYLPKHNGVYDFDSIRQKALGGPRVTTLLSAFEAIASGESQVPQENVEAAEQFLAQGQEFLEYHQVFQKNLGTFVRHACASIPFVLEEWIRIGLAIHQLASVKRVQDDAPFCYYETSAADGTMARTLAEYSGGLIASLTDSPNESNKREFERLCSHNFSFFHKGLFVDITPEFLIESVGPFSNKFDVIYENTTFQMYGSDRDQQIAYVRRVLKEDGLMIFLEKMKHTDVNEYERREQVKDRLFKSKYFSSNEIEAKKANIIAEMELGQVTLTEFARIVRRHFKYVYLIWNSGNFYEIAASNARYTVEYFLSKLKYSFVPSEFACDIDSDCAGMILSKGMSRLS
jgi:tRNA (cmo5U34)-methyltransferase